MAKLVFTRPRPSPNAGALVFGAGATGTAVQQIAWATLDADMPALQGAMLLAVATGIALDAGMPDVLGDLSITTAMPVAGQADMPAFEGDLLCRWDANTYRPQTRSLQSAWQQAVAVAVSTFASRWQNSLTYKTATALRWQAAMPAVLQTGCVWTSTNRCAHGTAARWQAAWQGSACASLRWHGARPLHGPISARHQQAAPQTTSGHVRWQGAQPLRHVQDARWQHARAAVHHMRFAFVQGLAGAASSHVRWQQAMQALAGISPHPVAPAKQHPCYDPITGGVLLFQDLAQTKPGLLLFRCRGQDASAPGQAHTIIRALAMYTHINNAHATLWPDGEPLPLYDCTIGTDAGGYSWRFSGTGPAHVMDMLAPRANGTPVKIKLDVCGVQWILAVGMRRRTRQFGRSTVTFDAASSTSLIDAPFARERTFANAQQQTAQQLALDALEFTGVTLDWQIDDWLVPAGVYSHQGTPLSAVLRVADAVGAVVQSHRMADTLIVQPRYAAMPWEWTAATPALQLPIGYCTTESLDEQRHPPYNAVFTSGTVAGQVRRTKRAGTAGDLETNMAIDALLTESIAHQQRARSILGAGGWQANVALTLPFDTAPGAPGLVDVGSLIEVADVGKNWRALVRSTRLQVGSKPGIRQTINVERHLHTEAA